MTDKNIEDLGADSTRAVNLIGAINSLLIDPNISLKQASEQITNQLRIAGNYSFAGLFIRSDRLDDQLILDGYSTKARANLLNRPLHLKLDHPWLHEAKTDVLIEVEPALRLSENHLGLTGVEIGALLTHVPVKSLYVLKLNQRHHLRGLLVIGFTTPIESMPVTEVELLKKLLAPLEALISHKQLMSENVHLRKQLKQSETKQTTMDETRDDFISMASHQLRTPLTAIKGYVSMLLEGDAGNVSEAQRNMLSQAYISCQRMVYIISDLLNVSRLKTGKFTISPSLINLNDIVSEEVSQIKEMATSRSLQIAYNPPDSFPDLLLDDIKIRQVIMNFLDNAIYYTRSGGQIEVSLTDKSETVELTVKDNGIGVPKSEQPHLFSKFYRATNARKARPDGMGLGLFMAKKIIAAEGGAIIFSSTENKGSTFGFILSKQKLQVEAPVAQDWQR